MRIAYFDCFSGISGDMVLGALVDAGANLPEIEAQLRRLHVPDWKISSEKVTRHGLSATRVLVETAETHHHRSLSHILQIIERAAFPARIAERASGIFTRLGEAEASVHGVPIEQVHFHEVGAVDAIVDIVGAAIGFEQLGIETFACSQLNVGGGRVNTQHGWLPVPAPATAELLRGAPTYSSGVERELVTPTGAAIAATMASRFGPQPAMTGSAIGYGAGAAELRGQANALRIIVGESIGESVGEWAGDTLEQSANEPNDETIVVLEANLDDMSPQVYGYFAERALEGGALDVYSTPVNMKKNRPGQLITVLCDAAHAKELTDLLFRETTTLGVRYSSVQRRTLHRDSIALDTPLGPIRVKVGRLNGHILNIAPEYEDCRKVAVERGVPLKQVLAEVTFEFQKRNGAAK